jgi:activator of HSP90 ATPase
MDSIVRTRRSFAAKAAALPAAFAMARAHAAADSMQGPAMQGPATRADGISRDAAAIHQEIVFQAPRDRVYRTLTSAQGFDRVVRMSAAASVAGKPGAPATQIEAVVGSAFTLFGGYVTGRQIELVPSERIVQVWRAGSWEPGAFSLANFVLRDDGAHTRLIFDHRGFPGEQAEHLANGWHLNYWDPMAKALSQG